MEIKRMFIKQIDTVNILEFDKYIMDSFMDISSDVELIILKGHILIEYMINLSIEKFAFKKASTITDWQFTNKLVFLEALGLFEGDEGSAMSEQIRAITKMRNDIAHNLSFNSKEFENLIKYYPSVSMVLKKRGDKVPISLGLNFIITFICGFIIGRLKIKIDVNNLAFDCIDEMNVKQFFSFGDGMLQRHRDAINHVFLQFSKME